MLSRVSMIAVTLASLACAGAATAAPGDLYRVAGERVNLRAGPSDSANVRNQLLRGEELIELRREGSWLGVRTVRTGEEGWIFSELLDPVAVSSLQGGAAVPPGPFSEISGDFDRLVAATEQRRGFGLFDSVRQLDGNSLAVTLTPDWLRAGSDDEHMLAALAIYQMWKHHQNGAPVRVVLLQPGGADYLEIDDTEVAATPRISLSAASP